MRLGQLARKLDIKVNQIVDFLEKEHKVSLESDLNSKIEGENLDFVLEKFKPEIEEVEIKTEIDTPIDEVPEVKIETEEIIEQETTPEVIDIKKIEEPIVEQPIEVEKIIEEHITEKTEDEKLIVESEDGEEIELHVVDGVIKAPKKELSGFKVVGKIELEQPKKCIQHIKTEDNETVNITEDIDNKKKELAQLKREKYLKRKEARKKKQEKKSNRHSKRKVLTELELKEKQAELLIEKRLQQAKVDKNKKKKHYEQIIKSKPKSKHNKKKGKKKVDESIVKTVKQFDKEPTTTLGKIWKWFNT